MACAAACPNVMPLGAVTKFPSEFSSASRVVDVENGPPSVSTMAYCPLPADSSESGFAGTLLVSPSSSDSVDKSPLAVELTRSLADDPRLEQPKSAAPAPQISAPLNQTPLSLARLSMGVRYPGPSTPARRFGPLRTGGVATVVIGERSIDGAEGRGRTDTSF
jgi:hypothetical protein